MGEAGRRARGRRPGRRSTHPSARTLAARAAAVPAITYPEELPVTRNREQIAAAIRDHQVVVVAGETGSGKTTQIPKICLELGRGIVGTIGHTQPRRIAARTVAERIAEELGVPLGGAVGYQVRFTDEVSETTLVKLMTDGILLAEIQRDPLLERYDTVIVDEAHERSLNIDFILGYLAELLPRRPDLKVIITSATIDSAKFAAHFGAPGAPAPVIEVSGRTYPVEIRYRPLLPEDEPDEDRTDTDEAGTAGTAGADAVGTDAVGTDEPAEDGPPDPPRRVSRSGRDTPPTRAVSRPKGDSRRGGGGGSVGGSGGARVGGAVEPLDQTTAICRAVDELLREGPGDVLVFLSGEREIRDTADGLREHLGTRFTLPGVRSAVPGAVEVLPLYARLSAAEQHRVFERHEHRRVVLATNVAETSLTVPGVRYVVDPGTARISRYSHRTKVQRLPIEPVSRASANQRAGRCGRVADGVCIRLYSQRDLESRPEFTEPEILRTSLASVILQMTALNLGELADFPFVDPPDPRAVRDGLALLTELGALETSAAGRRLTAVGRSLAQLPVDPRLGRMLVEAGRLGVVREVLVIVAALAVQDVRERPTDAQQAADEKHRRFADPTSDFLTLLNLWEYLREQQRDLSSSAFRRLCRAEYLNWLRVREWQDVHEQLRQLAKPLGLTTSPHPAHPPAGRPAAPTTTTPPGSPTAAPHAAHAVNADAVHRALLAGLLSHVGMWEERTRDYLGARGSRFVVFPGSALAKKPPAWVMAAELVETSRLFARVVARIRPEWVEPIAEHVVRRTYAEPRWSGRRGAALVTEKVLLYGIPVVAARPVLLGRIDPVTARDLFIRHALVEGDWRAHHRFLAENRALLEEAEELEHRTRRRDLVVDAEALVDFYDERLPESIVSGRHFDSWWKAEQRTRPELLTFSLEMLAPGAAGVDAAAFPESWRQGDLTLPLTYQFAPGTPDDGVTVHVPLAVLPRLRPEGFDWLVPGLLDELVVATIRSLPKAVRVQLVPAPDVARAVVDRLPAWTDVAPTGSPPFREAFAAAVRALRGVEVPEDAWDDERLPAHLRMRFRAVGERGEVVDESTSLLALQRRLAPRTAAAVRAAVRGAVRAAASGPPHDRERSRSQDVPDPSRNAGGGALRTFPAELPGGRLAEIVETVGPGGLRVEAFPALVVEPGRPHGGSLPGEAPPARGAPRVRSAAGGAAAAGVPTVSLQILATRAEATAAHPDGIRHLLLADLGLPTGRVTSRWSGSDALTLAASPYPSTDALVRDVELAAISRLTAGDDLVGVRDPAAYGALAGRVRDRLEDEVHRVVAEVVRVLGAWRELDAAIRDERSPALLATLADVRAQAGALVGPGFVARTPPERLRDLPRYLRAAGLRLAKAVEQPARDAAQAWTVRGLEEALAAARAAVDAGPPDPVRVARADDARWLIEELRVSLFAQQLGTATPVSEKRVSRAIAGI